jgi:hypothetical protein
MYSRQVEVTPTRRPIWRSVQYPALLGYPDWGFPCFSSVLKQILGYKWKGARAAYTRSWRPSAEVIPPSQVSQRPSAEVSPILGSTSRHPSNQRTTASRDHPQPEANPPVLTCQDITPVSVSTSPVIVYKDLFPISSNASSRQEWFSVARDDA